MVSVKVEEEVDESDSEYQEDSGSENFEKPNRMTKRKEPRRSQKRSNIPRKSQQSNVFGPETDTFEKLFENEISGTSPKFPTTLHLNISEKFRLPDGEVLSYSP